MFRACGTVAEVRYRVDRLIEEKLGKMRELNHTVTLKNPRGKPSLCDECLCFGEMGDCPRGELMYWREIWLERVNGEGQIGPGIKSIGRQHLNSVAGIRQELPTSFRR